jgi:tRNA1Val (adenine37-N6)-methyltransferase
LPDDYRQPEGGYRFSQDSVLLARFVPPLLEGRAADLGAGCGVVGLEALAQGRLGGLGTLFLIEAGRDFRDSLRENAARALASRPDGPEIVAIEADWRFLGPSALDGPLDFLVVNPPYHKGGSSGQARAGRLQARHETMGGLGDLFGAAGRLLRPLSPMALSFPRERLRDLVGAAAAAGFAASRFHMPPRRGLGLVLAEFRSPPPAWQRAPGQPGQRGHSQYRTVD